MPRGIPNKVLEAEEHVRQSPPLDPSNRADSEIEVIPPLQTPEAELELFMHDVLTVMVAESNDPNAPPSAEVSVNGRRIFIPRGVETDKATAVMPNGQLSQVPITRMYIERLARAKKTSYSQNLDPRLGESINQLQRKRALDYPFAVLRDPNPRGAEWLKRILAEA